MDSTSPLLIALSGTKLLTTSPQICQFSFLFFVLLTLLCCAISCSPSNNFMLSWNQLRPNRRQPAISGERYTTNQVNRRHQSEALRRQSNDPQSLRQHQRGIDNLPETRIATIVVGNEVLTFNDTSLNQNLLPAMQSVYGALESLGLEKQVVVTTTHSLSILQTSYPPSAGEFRRDLVELVTQILSFHVKTGSPFLINAYPFFAYKANPKQIQLDFVLFEPNLGIVDPISNLRYDNMLFGQIDSVYTAMASLGFKKVPIHVSETGWPSKGDEDEFGATPENARKYNGNLLKLMAGNSRGTPMRPDLDLKMFVFALFNENLKPGPASERNYGLFKPDGTPAYQLGLSRVQGVGNFTGDGESRKTPPAPVRSSTTGYLSVSLATVKRPWCNGVIIIISAALVSLLVN